MKLSTERILTTHVGSLARPPDLFDMLATRASGQPYDAVAFEARVRQERRPEWGTTVAAFDGEEPDVEELARRRASTAQAHEMAAKLVPDVELLADRRNAVERRVAVLESSLGEVSSANPLFETPDIEQLLLARVVAARNAGPLGEALPVLLDEPFLRLHGESKWAMLDLVERLAEKTQMIYLTDDVDVVVWARRRSATGAIALTIAVPLGIAIGRELWTLVADNIGTIPNPTTPWSAITIIIPTTILATNITSTWSPHWLRRIQSTRHFPPNSPRTCTQIGISADIVSEVP